MVHSHAAIQAAFLVFCASRGKKNSTTDPLFFNDLSTAVLQLCACLLIRPLYSFHYIVESPVNELDAPWNHTLAA